MEQTVFVAVDIGCIECRESSAVLGIFRSREEAEGVAEVAEVKQREEWGGQHSFEVFEAELPHAT